MNFSELKGVRILVVDDEPLLLDTLKEHLELEGATVSTAFNGNEAFELLRRHEFNLILSDVRMPECSGVELLAKIREFKDIAPPVVLMSAFSDISDKKAKELGARGMFLKPENLKYLKELLIETLNNPF